MRRISSRKRRSRLRSRLASDFARPRGRYPAYTRDRLRDLARRLARRIRPETFPVARLEVAGPTDRIPLAQAERLEFRPASIGMPLGPLWATWWFRVGVAVPQSWAG